MPTLTQLRDTLLKPNDLLAGFGVEALLGKRPRPRRRPARRRPSVLPKQQPPLTIGLEYARALRAAVGRLQAMVRARLAPMLREDGQRMDAPPAADGEAMARALEGLEAEWWETEGAKLTELAGRVGAKVSTHQERELVKQLSAAASVQKGLRQRPSARAGQAPKLPLVRDTLREFQAQNVALIQSIPEKAHQRLRSVLADGIAKGRTVEQIGLDIEGEFEVTKRRALLIARDQTMTLAEQLNRERQKAIGVTEYIWRARGGPVGDGRNRREHLALHGTRQRLDQPPVVDSAGNRAQPGEQVNCRCWSEPVLDSDGKWAAWWESPLRTSR